MDKRRLMYAGSILLAAVIFYISFVALYKTSGLDRVIDAVVSPQSAPVVKVTSINVWKTTVDGKKFIRVEWNNLPEGTTAIDIYRSKEGRDWEKWQTVPIRPGEGGHGSIEFGAPKGDDPYEYFYYEEAVGGGGGSDSSAGGDVLWTSSSTQPQAPPPPPAPGDTGGAAGTGTENPGTSNPPPAQGQTGQSSSTQPSPTSTPQNPPSSGTSGESTSTVYYYSPSGEITGSSTIGAASDFSVHHLNNKIQIEWRSLPSNTDTVLISRSANQSGPWDDLLRRTGNPVAGEIGLLDQTVGQTFYYKLTAYANSVTVATAGPVRLDPE